MLVIRKIARLCELCASVVNDNRILINYFTNQLGAFLSYLEEAPDLHACQSLKILIACYNAGYFINLHASSIKCIIGQ